MSNDKMNVLFLWTVNPGVCWYRMYCFAQKMSELGLAHCRLFPDFDPNRLLSPDWERKLNENIVELEAQVAWADIVVCQYINSAEGLSTIQAIRDLKPILMEVDDYFKQVPYQSVAYDENRPGDGQDLWATRQIIESSGVIVSTPWLKEQYTYFNANIEVIPNCIDFTLWDQYESPKHDLIRIGWIGGATHEGDLKIVRDVLFRLLQAYPGIEIYIVSAPPPAWQSHDRLYLVNAWARVDQYPKHVKNLSFDIGLAPLRDNLFNRGKSNLRALEYSACKIPTVSSWVEPYKNGVPLLHCRTEDSWVGNLSTLIENESERKKRGQEAYHYVRENFNLERVAVKYADYLKDFVEKS